MTNWLGYTGVSLLAFGCLGLASLSASTTTNSTETAGASVRLNFANGAGTCSATHLGAGRYLTAAHCLGHGDIKIVTDKGATASAEVLWGSKLYDLALLRASGLKPRSAAIDCQLAKPGSAVTAEGNPLGMAFLRTPGVIVSGLQTDDIEVDGDKVWPERIVADITVAPGSSGGGLFNEAGKLVGVVVGSAPPFRYAFIVPSTTVCQFLAR